MTVSIYTTSSPLKDNGECENGIRGTIRIRNSEMRKTRILQISPLLPREEKALLQFLNPPPETWQLVSATIRELAEFHLNGILFSTYIAYESKSIRGIFSLEPDPCSPGNLLFSSRFLCREEDFPEELFSRGAWKWIAQDLLPRLRERDAKVPLFKDIFVDTFPLKRATIRLNTDDPPISKELQDIFLQEGFQITDERDWIISVREIFRRQQIFLIEEEESFSDETPPSSLNSEKSCCTIF